MKMKAGRLSEMTAAAGSSLTSASASVETRRRCTSTTARLLILVSFTLVAYLSFSDQLRLPWVATFSYKPTSYPYFNHIFNKPAAQGSVSPSFAPTNLSHIVFAIGGSAKMWNKRRAYIELWWRPNQTRGHVWFDQEPAGPWPDTSPPYRISRNTSKYGDKASASRIATAVVEAYQLVSSEPQKESVRWFVMGDDDTVFFLDNLVTVLQKYNHEQMYYVGMSSESVDQDLEFNYGMAFGGGGFAISYPAVAELAGVMDACLERYASSYGSDERLHACLAELGIPLTHEPGFHQVDLKEDVYGMLAAHPIAPLVSLHHLDLVKPIMPNKSSQLESLQFLFSAYRLDSARILQQAFCYDTRPGAGAESESEAAAMLSVSVSWGYTVQVYPGVVAPRELETPLQTFKTWRMNNGPYIFKTRPFGEPCMRPFIFFLDGVLQNHTDTTLTQYTRAHVQAEDQAKCNKQGFSTASRIEKVKVFAPRMNPFSWKQAPRRHCCMTQRTETGKILEVRIKHCSPGEYIMPPLSA